MDIEPAIDFFESNFCEPDAAFPYFEVFVVAALELDEFGLTFFEHVRLFLTESIDVLIDLQKSCDRVFFEQIRLQLMFPTPENHPELRTPVTDMVVGDHIVSHETCNTGECIADNRRSDMTDMHGFGDIRGGEINDNRFRVFSYSDAQTRITEHRKERLREERWAHAEIDETRTGDFCFSFRKLAEAPDDILSKGAWILFDLTRQRHSSVALVISIAQILGYFNVCPVRRRQFVTE